MAFTTWSTTDKDTTITLSGGNLIATLTSAAGIVRAADKQVTGKFYWEYTVGVFGGNNSGIGIATANASTSVNGILSTYTGTLNLNRAGTILRDGVNSGSSLAAPAAGNVFGVAVDLNARLAWMRLAPSGNWNGSAGADPATGAGGISVLNFGIGIAVAPAACFNLTNDQFTANFGGSAFTGAVPAGFTSGFISGANPPNNVVATQSALEQFLTTTAPAQVTQVTIEQWATTATISGQAIVTQVALEQWVPAITVSNVDLAGNLGGVSHYGKLKYGLGHYSRIDAFVPAFAADLTVVAALNFAGGLSPTIVLAADLDVHVNLIELRGDLAPQIALEGALSLLVPLDSLLGSFGFEVVYGASSFISGPLWADAEPCPPPLWGPSEPCPHPVWMTAPPCEPVVWSKTRLCNG